VTRIAVKRDNDEVTWTIASLRDADISLGLSCSAEPSAE
jgi:hypothetical protein